MSVPDGEPRADAWADRLVSWQARHGRNSLPWQNTRDPYRVWLSEVMLQQTQVSTVLGYYQRFLQAFPDVQALSSASLDDVLALWSGLGYYSRARNLHACAQRVVDQHGGQFPTTADQLEQLPGIGRSTAAAIASICHGERVAILDGNVKRVLTRALGFGADLAVSAHERQLWARAGELLPQQDLPRTMPRYTQAVMDLGATVCLPRQPNCPDCPVADLCVARLEGSPERYPVKTRRVRRTTQSLWLLWAHTRDEAVWLVQRPTPGIWAGLFSLPQFDSATELEASVPARFRSRLQPMPASVHVLTHRDLHLHPVRVQLPASALQGAQGQWFAARQWRAMGIPAPVRRLLELQS